MDKKAREALRIAKHYRSKWLSMTPYQQEQIKKTFNEMCGDPKAWEDTLQDSLLLGLFHPSVASSIDSEISRAN